MLIAIVLRFLLVAITDSIATSILRLLMNWCQLHPTIVVIAVTHRGVHCKMVCVVNELGDHFY